MGNDAETAPVGDDLSSRLKKIDALLDQNEALRKKKTAVSLLGVVVLLAVLLLFVYRLYNHGVSLVDQRIVIAEKVWEQTEPVLTHEIKILATDVREKAAPELSQAMMEAFKADLPNLEKAGGEMGERLYEHSKQTVEAVLIETLAASLEKSGADLGDTFKDVSSIKLDDQLSISSEMFAERAYEVIEARFARVGTSIEGLKTSVKKVADSRGSEELKRDRLDWAEDELLSALVDLVVYEIKPELGREPATPKTEGGAQ